MRRIGGLSVAGSAFFAILLPAFSQVYLEESGGVTVIVTSDLCAGLTLHRPDDDVAYRPGESLSGVPVAPADLPGSGSLHLDLDDIAIDPRIPLRAFVEIPESLEPVLGAAEISVGRIGFRDGRPHLGDRPLRPQEEHALAVACAELQREVLGDRSAEPVPAE